MGIRVVGEENRISKIANEDESQNCCIDAPPSKEMLELAVDSL